MIIIIPNHTYTLKTRCNNTLYIYIEIKASRTPFRTVKKTGRIRRSGRRTAPAPSGTETQVLMLELKRGGFSTQSAQQGQLGSFGKKNKKLNFNLNGFFTSRGPWLVQKDFHLFLCGMSTRRRDRTSEHQPGRMASRSSWASWSTEKLRGALKWRKKPTKLNEHISVSVESSRWCQCHSSITSSLVHQQYVMQSKQAIPKGH